jgi:hypothetical protein
LLHVISIKFFSILLRNYKMDYGILVKTLFIKCSNTILKILPFLFKKYIYIKRNFTNLVIDK